jgi:hypothetical protein
MFLATLHESRFRIQPFSAEALPKGHIHPSHRAFHRHAGRESRPLPLQTKAGEVPRRLLRIPILGGLQVRSRAQEGPAISLAAAADPVREMKVADPCPPIRTKPRTHRPCPISDRRNPWSKTSDHDPAVRVCDRACPRIENPSHKPHPCPLRDSHRNRRFQHLEGAQRLQTPTCFLPVSALHDDHRPMMRDRRGHKDLSTSLATLRHLICLLQSHVDSMACLRREGMYRQGVSGRAPRRAMRAPTLDAARICHQTTPRSGGDRSWSLSRRSYPSVAPPAMDLSLVPSFTRLRGRLHWKFHPEGDHRTCRKDSIHLL